MLCWALGSQWKKFKRSCSNFIQPPSCFEQKRGRVVYELIFLPKKAFLICTIIYLLSTIPSYLEYFNCDIRCDQFRDMTRVMRNVSFEKSLLLGSSNSPVFWPLLQLENLIRDHKDYVPNPNLFVYSILYFLLYIYYLLSSFKLLRQQYFQLNSTSVFREMFSSWQMGSKCEAMAPRKLRKNYLNIKTKMKISWQKWTPVGISIALLINVILICWLVLLCYFVTVTGSFHELVLMLMPNATFYYVFSGFCYVLCKHVVPLKLFYLRNLGYQNQETKLNFYAGRVFFLVTSFYLILLLALASEFPSAWPRIFQMHLYIHTAIDVIILAMKALGLCLPWHRVPRFNKLVPFLHPLDEFTLHEKLTSYSVNLFVFNLAICISVPLTLIILLKLFLTFILTYIVANCSSTLHQGFYNSQNVRFMEKMFTTFLLSVALFIESVYILPTSFTQCSELLQLLNIKTLTIEPLKLLTGQNIAISACFILICLVLLKTKIIEHCHRMEGRYLKRHLEDINQDKHYQVMKQKQWYPNCKCHESRTRKTSRPSGIVSKSNSRKT